MLFYEEDGVVLFAVPPMASRMTSTSTGARPGKGWSGRAGTGSPPRRALRPLRVGYLLGPQIVVGVDQVTQYVPRLTTEPGWAPRETFSRRHLWRFKRRPISSHRGLCNARFGALRP